FARRDLQPFIQLEHYLTSFNAVYFAGASRKRAWQIGWPSQHRGRHSAALGLKRNSVECKRDHRWLNNFAALREANCSVWIGQIDYCRRNYTRRCTARKAFSRDHSLSSEGRSRTIQDYGV